jgi:hypothetical protein
MGWASGSLIADAIIKTVKAEVKDKEARRRIYLGVIRALENGDWDTQDESLGQDPAFDVAMRELHPDWEEL